MWDDAKYLTRFIEARDEAAFTELVRRYAGLVHGVARRRLGNPASAQDVAQAVFLLLARKPRQAARAASLGAWLHRATVWEARNHSRKESTRRKAMKAFATAQDRPNETARDAEFSGLVDEAVNSLGAKDRTLLFARFFEGRTFREIGQSHGLGEDAIRKRMDKILATLAAWLNRQERGAAGRVSAVALTSMLASEFAEAAPPGLVASVSKSALAATQASSSGGSGFALSAFLAGKVKFAVAALASMTVAVPAGMIWERASLQEQQSSQLAMEPRPLLASRPMFSADLIKRGRLDLAAFAGLVKQLVTEDSDSLAFLEARELLMELAEEDLEPVLEILKGIPNVGKEYSYQQLFESLFARWGEINPLKALAKADSLRSLFRGHASSFYISISPTLIAWAERDFEAAFAWAREHGDWGSEETKHWGLEVLVGQAVERSGLEAAQLLKGMQDPALLAKLRMAIFRAFGRRNLSEAFAWAQSLPEPDKREELIREGLSDWDGGHSAKEALALARPYAERSWFPEFLRQALGQLSYETPGQALKTYHELPEDWKKDSLKASLASSLVLYDSKAALALTEGIDTKLRNEWAEQAIRTSVEVSHEQALEFAGLLPNDRRDFFFGLIAKTWARRDPNAVESWLRSLAEGSSAREEAALAFVKERLEDDPQSAVTWANSIRNEWRQHQAILAIKHRWMEIDPVAAQAWLESRRAKPEKNPSQF